MELPQHVAIVGGGLSGLSLSLALQKVNIPCTVYEERAESYETGGGITLSPNILDELGVYDRVRDKGYHFDTLAFSDNDGAIKDVYYFGSEKLYGYRGFRIMSIKDSEKEVAIEFADGSVESSDIVVGADGIHSAIRKHIVPDVKPGYSGLMAINSACSRSGFLIPENFHLPATVMSKVDAFLMRMHALRTWASGRSMGSRSSSKWASSTDRVIVLGDAAHVIPPTAGQGVNQAFEDNLSPQTPLVEALKFWQDYRQRQIDKILELTQQMNPKHLPPAEQANLPPGAIWTDDSATSGEGGQLGWLYEPDLDEDVAKWLADHGSSTGDSIYSRLFLTIPLVSAVISRRELGGLLVFPGGGIWASQCGLQSKMIWQLIPALPHE
ncbi:hypothetical protein BDFG_06973 [Blastomyces dermatitidis ATCC 26199]|nr:hypothetical protein BDFG_06973 [Blastomyces dermatitidis ATCC 26199]